MSDYDLHTIIKILERDVASLKEDVDALRNSVPTNKAGHDLQVVVLKGRVEQLEKDIKELNTVQLSTFVTMARYIWTERLVMGFAALILTGFVTGLVALVIPAVRP